MDNRIMALDSDSRCVQGQLEGLFRQLYQGCTQQQIVGGFRVYRSMMTIAQELFESLEAIKTEVDALLQTEREGAAQEETKSQPLN